MIGESSNGPRSSLLQHHSRGPRAPPAATKQIVGRGRQAEHRTDAPDNAAGPGSVRRQEQALRDIGQSKLPSRAGRYIPLRDDGQDRPGDDVPISANGEGNDRLEIQGCPPAIVIGADTAIVVELERDTDQVGNRVAEFFGEVGLLTLYRGRAGG